MKGGGGLRRTRNHVPESLEGRLPRRPHAPHANTPATFAIGGLMETAYRYSKILALGDDGKALANFAGLEAHTVLNNQYYFQGGEGDECPPFEYCNFYLDPEFETDMICWHNNPPLNGLAQKYEVYPFFMTRQKFDKIVFDTFETNNWDEDDLPDDIDMGYFWWRTLEGEEPIQIKQADLSDNAGIALVLTRMWVCREDLDYLDKALAVFQRIFKNYLWTDTTWGHRSCFIGRHDISKEGALSDNICTGCNFALLYVLQYFMDCFDDPNSEACSEHY